MFQKENRANTAHGILLIALFSFAAFYISEIPFVRSLSLSPLIVGIILGMLYANSLRNRLPETWVPGIKFCTKQILRTGIVLYGFRLTLAQVAEVGLPAIVFDSIIVGGTIFLGIVLGRWLKMDSDTALMTSTGSAICGAAAVLGAEPVVRCEGHKTAIAVSTVVIFGTIAMFLYPSLYRAGLFNITKMIRVMLLAPVLLIMGIVLDRLRNRQSGESGGKRKITIPWFAFWFIVVIGINTLLQTLTGAATVKDIPLNGAIEYADTFMLTMAMTALGAETSIDKFKKAGAKPFVLAALLFVWLFGGGWLLAKYLLPLLGC